MRKPKTYPQGRAPAAARRCAVNCGNCGHARDEHNGRGVCINYDISACICNEYINPEDATPEMRAKLLFGRMFHSVYSRRDPFAPGGPCDRDRCGAAAVRRIMVNLIGTVVEYDVCRPCAEQYHGNSRDDFPVRTCDAPPLLAEAQCTAPA